MPADIGSFGVPAIPSLLGPMIPLSRGIIADVRKGSRCAQCQHDSVSPRLHVVHRKRQVRRDRGEIDIFAAEHGSWNRKKRTGYEVIRVPLTKGKATGEYEDFLTGFVTPEGKVWGRPVGVTVGNDGSLFVSDDGSKSIWRVSYTGK